MSRTPTRTRMANGSALATDRLPAAAVELTGSSPRAGASSPGSSGSLERADMPLRAGEALFFYVRGVRRCHGTASPVADARTSSARSSSSGSWPPAPADRRQPPGASGRSEQFERQLPDTLQLLSSTLAPATPSCRASRRCRRRSQEPMGTELRRVVTEARLGRPLEESLDGVADAHGVSRLRVGGHGHPHPARGRRQPGRAAA